MNGPFTMSKHDSGDGIVRIVLGGEVDADVSNALTMMLLNAVEQGGVSVLLIDLERLGLITAAGIRSLLEGRQAALSRGLAYGVVNADGLVRATLIAGGASGLLSPHLAPTGHGA
ncbi:STAS domain-containing protein [Paractinoplanes atraurantiacus]|uniref:Anti-anti-sigma factor n=1 Tax=Paractinoplanes atraurantiacus TaxID=1036182 RepID=A0A285J3G5_9ACTN|nr:STAS domain-containing protein [Actinoplanes atraurantiacus]SNY54875.1 anti-anti-sigma factor [Actinoplanes atraurantiacus]